MKILFVTPRLPLPADTGAKIRTFNLIKNAAINNQVSLLSFCHEENEEAINHLKGHGLSVHLVKAKDNIRVTKILGNLPVSIEKYHSEEMDVKLKGLLANEKFDLIHFDHLHMGQYRDSINGLPCILDEHNVESLILSRCASIERGLLKKMLFKSQSRRMVHFESNLVSRFRKCLTVSDKDRESLLRMSGNKADIEVIPNGVDTDFFRDSPLRGQSLEDSLVFTGSMDWLPNSGAVEYFCKDILPLIWKKKQQVKFYIVGKNPSKSVINLGKTDSRIIVTGLVDDVRPYIAKSKVFVVPIRTGGGTRLKILEAMSMSKPVVSTTIGAEGINYTQNKNIILKDSPEDFAQAVLELLGNNPLRDLLGDAGRNLVCNNYDWKIIWQKLEKVYEQALK